MISIAKRIKTITIISVCVCFMMSMVIHDASAAATYDYYSNGRLKSITYFPPENGVTYIE